MTILKKYKPAGMFILFLFCSALFTVRPLWASIAPEEVAVIVNTESKDSLRIGELYARLRNVPPRNLIRISAPVNEWISRTDYEKLIAGPVNEPYLTAFPPPSVFFPLLMSGKYTLVEVFAMTNPFLSWQMILVGDPLYNPFKNNPAFVLENPPPPPD